MNKKIFFVLIVALVVAGTAISGGAIRLIVPTLSDLSGFTAQEGELGYDDSTSRVKVYKSGSYMNLVPTLVEELPGMTGKANQKLVVNSAEDGVEWSDLPQVAYIKDIKANNIQGDVVSVGTYGAVTLNSLSGDSDWVSLSGNDIILDAGKYSFSAKIPVSQTTVASIGHHARLVSVSDSSTLIDGGQAVSTTVGSSGTPNMTYIFIEGELLFNTSTPVRLVHQATISGGVRGWYSNITTDFEIYTQVKIIKLK